MPRLKPCCFLHLQQVISSAQPVPSSCNASKITLTSDTLFKFRPSQPKLKSTCDSDSVTACQIMKAYSALGSFTIQDLKFEMHYMYFPSLAPKLISKIGDVKGIYGEYLQGQTLSACCARSSFENMIEFNNYKHLEHSLPAV